MELSLSIMEYGPRSGWAGSDLYRQLAEAIEISVTREEGVVPEIPKTEAGGNDYPKISPYFKDLMIDYGNIAERHYKKFIEFAKFELKQPYQNPELIDKDHFSNPSWNSDCGINYGRVAHVHHVQPVPGMDGRTLGAEPLRLESKTAIEHYFHTPSQVELYEEILSDAQAAIFDKNIRRAVFELAVVCELSTKRKYFAQGGISALAYDYFEDKGKIKITVLELLSSVANEVLGESFRVSNPQDFINIDHLFRCRNKVAHRGEVTFKNDSSNLVEPDLTLVEQWFASVSILLNWLSSK